MNTLLLDLLRSHREEALEYPEESEIYGFRVIQPQEYPIGQLEEAKCRYISRSFGIEHIHIEFISAHSYPFSIRSFSDIPLEKEPIANTRSDVVTMPIRYIVMMSFASGLLGFFGFLSLCQLISRVTVLHWLSLIYGILGSLALLGTVILKAQEIKGE